MNNWKSYIRRVEPYVPGEQPQEENIIKLNTNENPYPPSPLVNLTLKSTPDEVLKLYPDPGYERLQSVLADYHGVEKNQVFAGVGSDDVLGMLFMTFFNSDKNILFPDITYSFYPVWAELLGIQYKCIPVKEDFTIDISDYYQDNGGIVIANPNAPTGIYLGKDKIKELLEENRDSIVIVDEAYIDFASDDSSCLDLIPEFDNLVVVRTFSKSRSLAGLRVGYAISNPEIIKYLNDVKYSYNSYTLNTLSINLAEASVKDNSYFKDTVNKIKYTRERFTSELKNLGFKVLPSSANFVFASYKENTGKKIFEYLKNQKIYVRYFDKPGISDYLRITIGRDEDMDILLEKLKQFLTSEI